MIEEILNIVAYKTRITLRIFDDLVWDEDKHDYKPSWHDVELTYDNLDAYKNYSLSCIVPTAKDELMIECTK